MCTISHSMFTILRYNMQEQVPGTKWIMFFCIHSLGIQHDAFPFSEAAQVSKASVTDLPLALVF